MDTICPSPDGPDLSVEPLDESRRRLILTTVIFCQIDCPGIKRALRPPMKVWPALFYSWVFSLTHGSSARGPLGDERLPLQAKSMTLPKPEAHSQGNYDDTGGPDADFG